MAWQTWKHVMTDPLINYRTSTKKIKPELIKQAYVVTDGKNQPLLLCILTVDGWIEISPVNPTLVAELEFFLGELQRHPLHEAIDFKVQNTAIVEATKTFITAISGKSPTFKI